MSESKKRPYGDVMPTAQEIVGKLSPYCNRIEIAGSLRRGRPTIGDIEIVALPKMGRRPIDLFGQQHQETNLLDRFLEEKQTPMTKNGAKYKQFKYGGFTVDLFLPESTAHWGCVFLIRTGSHDFNMWLMNEWQHVAGVLFRHGRLLSGGQLLDTPEETAVFDALGLSWIPPQYRDDSKWLEMMK